MLHRALQAVSDTVAKGGRILFVGTKRQAQDADRRGGQEVGAVLRQFALARRHADQLEDGLGFDQAAAQARRDAVARTRRRATPRRSASTLQRERDKLDRALGGIKDMGGLPDLMFVIDTNKEDIAIKEARRLNVPVAAVVDTNCDPDGITYVVPGNDDASRAITLYCDLIAKAAIDGISRAQGETGIDVGAAGRAESPRNCRRKPTSSASRCCPARAALPTISRSLPSVSPAIEKKLNDLGIFHYLADRRTLARRPRITIGEEVGLPGRVEGWIAQAKELTRPSKPSSERVVARAGRQAVAVQRLF